MSNTNAQHLGYSPQIGRLTPEDFRSQSRLDRLSDFLRSLVLIPGDGVEISRDSSAGTVVRAIAAPDNSVTSSRFVTLARSGTRYVVMCPELIVFFRNHPNATSRFTVATVEAKTFTFTSGYPAKVGIRDFRLGGAAWIHDGADGADATTTDQYSLYTTSLWILIAKYSGILIEIPWYSSMPENDNFGLAWSKNGANLTISTNRTNNAQWFVGGSGEFNGNASGGWYFQTLTLTASQNKTYYYEIPENWYELWAANGFAQILLKEASEARSGYIYANCGSVITNGNNDIVYAQGPSPFPLWAPFDGSNASGTYVKTVSPLTTGTVTGVKGIITGAT